MFSASAPRVALSSSVLHATIVPIFYIGSSCSKIVVPFGVIPLNQLQSLRDRNPRGITFGYAARDHCFVIASEGVIKKDFFYCLPYGGNSHWLNCSCFAIATQAAQTSSVLRLTYGSAINPVVVKIKEVREISRTSFIFTPTQ